MTKFQAGIILTSQVMDCQVHAIRKAINPFLQVQSHMHMLYLALHKIISDYSQYVT